MSLFNLTAYTFAFVDSFCSKFGQIVCAQNVFIFSTPSHCPMYDVFAQRQFPYTHTKSLNRLFFLFHFSVSVLFNYRCWCQHLHNTEIVARMMIRQCAQFANMFALLTPMKEVEEEKAVGT